MVSDRMSGGNEACVEFGVFCRC